MNQAVVERALQALAEIGAASSTRAVSAPAAGTEPTDGSAQAALAWPAASLDAERRFVQPHARLFPFLGRKVRTPRGPGTLLVVFAERAEVLLDFHRDACDFFSPGEIEPVSWEVEP